MFANDAAPHEWPEGYGPAMDLLGAVSRSRTEYEDTTSDKLTRLSLTDGPRSHILRPLLDFCILAHFQRISIIGGPP